MYRKTWMEINLDAMVENIKRCIELSGKKMIAVLKADASGCGDSFVAKAALEAGAKMLAVSSLDEAIRLRNEHYTGPLLVFGPTEPEDCSILIRKDISVAAFSPEWTNAITKFDIHGLKIHLKVDTGMNRIGFQTIVDLKKAFHQLQDAGCIMEGIFTHYYCTETDDEVTQRQYELFKKAVDALQYSFPWIHCDNTDATVTFKDPLTNACRVGGALFGICAFEPFKQPIALYTEVAMVKKVPSLQTIGYGATYQTSEEEIIATLPIGYADGLIRENTGRNVYIDGQYCKIVGRICMDQIMVKLEKEVPVGTKVEIFGKHINIEDMATDLNTIPDEIISVLSDRITRTYFFHGKQIAEINAKEIKSHMLTI